MYIAIECNTLIRYDAAQQANKSCGSTVMHSLSPKSTAHFAEAGVRGWSTITVVLMRALCVFPPMVVPAGSYLGLRRQTHEMGKITSIGLHDCLAFIALEEVLLSQALPLLNQKKTIFVFVFSLAWFVKRWLYVWRTCERNKFLSAQHLILYWPMNILLSLKILSYIKFVTEL